jgi:APA family basic amino acid/polyamine antiporter
MVAVAVMVLRRTDANRQRAFRVPGLIVIGPATILGCMFLFFNLPATAMLVLPIWTAIGLLIYFGYSYRRSHLGQGRVEVHETEIEDIEPRIPGVDDEGSPDRPRRT